MPVNKGISAVFCFRAKNSFRKRGVHLTGPQSVLVKGQNPDNTLFSSGKEKNNLSISSKKSAIKSEGTEKVFYNCKKIPQLVSKG